MSQLFQFSYPSYPQLRVRGFTSRGYWVVSRMAIGEIARSRRIASRPDSFSRRLQASHTRPITIFQEELQ